MHELHFGVAGSGHELGVHLVGHEKRDAFVPNFLRFAHRDPDVRVDEVVPWTASTGSSVIVILAPEVFAISWQRWIRSSEGQSDFGAAMRRPSPSWRPPSGSEFPVLKRASPRYVKAMSFHFLPQDSFIVIRSQSICVGCHSSVRPLKTGTPAYWASSLRRSSALAAVFDGVHAAQNPGGVLDAFLCGRYLGGAGLKYVVCAPGSGGDLEGGASGWRSFSKMSAILALQELRFVAELLRERFRSIEVDEVVDFFGG